MLNFSSIVHPRQAPRCLARPLAALGLLLATAGAVQAQPATFGPMATYPVSGANNFVATGDLNSDGVLDLVSTSNYNVNVLLGQAAGGFAAAVAYPVGGINEEVALADVNHDGKLDVVLASGPNVRVLLGTGSGTLKAASAYPNGAYANNAPSNSYSLKLYDVTRDGVLDAVTTTVNTQVSVLPGIAAGTFDAASTYEAGSHQRGLSVADFNHDGFADLAISETDQNNVYVLLGQATGFAKPVSYPVGQVSPFIETADLNRDGQLDIIVSGFSATGVKVLTGNANGTFNAAVAYQATATSTFLSGLTVGDVNGDGYPDVLVGDFNQGKVYVLPGSATGALGAAVALSVGAGAYDIALADINRDNRLDLVVANSAGNTLGVLLNTTVSPLAASSIMPASGPAGTLVTITGAGLDRVRGVRFGTGGLGLIAAQSATSLTVRVPVDAASAPLTLVPATGSAVPSATSFTYAPRPAGLVATLSPAGPLDVCQPRTLTASAASPAFTIGSGFNEIVLSIVAQANGQVLVGGRFTTYQGVAAGRLVRLNADGTRDNSFATGAGFNDYVNSVVLQADGKVLVGGRFTTYQGTPANRLVRLNPDGTRDASFVTGAGFNYPVESVAVQADGRVLAGGTFTTYNGTPAFNLIRLSATGNPDATFATSAGFSTSFVYSVVVQANGQVLVGGEFRRYQGATANGLVRLNADGSRDANFTPSITGDVRCLAVQANGQILAGGNVGYVNQDPAHLIRLNANGSPDASFNNGQGGTQDFSNLVNSVAVQPDGKVLVGGEFDGFRTAAANFLIRLNADGSRDNSFAVGQGPNANVYSVAVQADGQVLAGGFFTAYQGAAANSLVRLTASGTPNNTPTPVGGASFSFAPGSSTTNPLVTSTPGTYTATASLNGETSAPSNAVVLTACTSLALRAPENPAGTVAGLRYQYYEASGANFTGLPDFAGLTPKQTGTAPGFYVSSLTQRSYGYALRYSGYVTVPADGQYTFFTTSDDGSQLFIGSQLVVDNDGSHGAQERSGTVGLQAGTHLLTVTYFQNGGGNQLSVNYQGPGVSKQAIPGASLRYVPASFLRAPENPASTVAGLRYQYYEASGANFTGLPDFAGLTPKQTGTAPGFDAASLAQRSYGYALRYSGYVTVPADGQYTFFTTSDDGSQLFIGSQLVVDNDGSHGAQERSGTVGLQAGTHLLTVTYFQNGGGNQLSVNYQGPGVSKQAIPGASLRYVPASASTSTTNALLVTTERLGAESLAAQAYPNPFTTEVTLSFTLPQAGTYSLAVYDVTGRLVEQLPGGQAAAGEAQQLTWTTARYASGFYLLRLRSAAGTQQLRLVKQ
ncbi:FG-GAP-like repeat-containing protein [Hymenobacter nivis]|uniref:T9SS C-terminal target domain-containing protein n=1 Tax=Hymenobacter nivis TaxID=1850093 RepID=A0A502GQG1_9BACT|nr:FG-GAP-like repeat-containing protein [Hymenobacter nivis]TPG64577.1 T9SS C-terminal target domain-containing protein [Hymenobacter nivis]